MTDQSRTADYEEPYDDGYDAPEAAAHMCGFCFNPPEKHGDSDAGPMTVCPPKDLMAALEASLKRARRDHA
jgi:hypothetical protein